MFSPHLGVSRVFLLTETYSEEGCLCALTEWGSQSFLRNGPLGNASCKWDSGSSLKDLHQPMWQSKAKISWEMERTLARTSLPRYFPQFANHYSHGSSLKSGAPSRVPIHYTAEQHRAYQHHPSEFGKTRPCSFMAWFGHWMAGPDLPEGLSQLMRGADATLWFWCTSHTGLPRPFWRPATWSCIPWQLTASALHRWLFSFPQVYQIIRTEPTGRGQIMLPVNGWQNTEACLRLDLPAHHNVDGHQE